MPLIAGKVRDVNLIALDEALVELEKIDPIRSRIVEMRFFGGLSNEEAAEVLGVSTATVQRQWSGAGLSLQRMTTANPFSAQRAIMSSESRHYLK